MNITVQRTTEVAATVTVGEVECILREGLVAAGHIKPDEFIDFTWEVDSFGETVRGVTISWKERS